jgi:hypothetical protein
MTHVEWSSAMRAELARLTHVALVAGVETDKVRGAGGEQGGGGDYHAPVARTHLNVCWRQCHMGAC